MKAEDEQLNEFARRVKQKAEDLAKNNKPITRQMNKLSYKPFLRKKFTEGNGSLDYEKLSEFLQEYISFVKLIIALNLTEEEFHEIIKRRQIKVYKFFKESFGEDFAKQIAISGYQHICKSFGISPDSNYKKNFERLANSS